MAKGEAEGAWLFACMRGVACRKISALVPPHALVPPSLPPIGKKPYGKKLITGEDADDAYGASTGGVGEEDDTIDDPYHESLEALFEKR